MRIVADTNVWVSGLINPRGKPGQVLAAIQSERVIAVASWDLATEIGETLREPRFTQYGLTEDAITAALTSLGSMLPDVEVEVQIRDPDDAAVVSSALAGRAEVIVTGDKDVLDDEELRAWLTDRGIEVMTPAEFVDRCLDGRPDGK